MALSFSKAQTNKSITLSNFLGLDYDTHETSTDLRRSKYAKNLIVNQNGYVEKRTGYKRVFENTVTDNINGIFTYHAQIDGIFSDIHIMHIGTKLYKFSIAENGSFSNLTLMLEGMENKKTRAFEFGSCMYILGAKYVKIGVDELTKTVVCGFVSAISTESDTSTPQTIISNRTPSYMDEVKLDGTTNNSINMSNIKKIISFDTSWNGLLNTSEVEKYKFIVAPQENAKNINITAVYVTLDNTRKEISYLDNTYTGSQLYSVKNDEKYGLYVTLNWNFVWAFIDTSKTAITYLRQVTKVEVEFCDNSFVYVPEIVNNRNPIAITEVKGTDTSDVNTRFGGNAVEGINMANPNKAITFYFNSTNLDKAWIRLYLMPDERAQIYRIKINDYIWHYSSFDTDANSTDRKQRLYISADGKYVDILKSYLVTNLGISECTITVYFTSGKAKNYIEKCNIYGIFGGDNDTRVFLSGNPEYPCRDFKSGLYDAGYFSDLDYTDIGGDNSKIVGYQKLYTNQIIVKDGNGGSATQYLRSYTSDENGKGIFTISQGNDSYSANCISSFKNIGGYPFYIGKDGLYMMYGTNVKSETNTACKSTLINRNFTAADTENMICIAHKNMLYCYSKNDMYICDTKREFEWYYIDSLPNITCLWEYGNKIYFGDTSGKVYCFMDASEKNAYYDDIAIDGSIKSYSKAIHAVWTIPQSAYEVFTNYKTIRNLHIACMPYNRSSVTIYYNSDEELNDEVLKENIDMFSFFDIDFNRFSFNTIKQPQEFATRVKLKNVYTFGITIENKAAGEPFGFIALTLTYRDGKVVK